MSDKNYYKTEFIRLKMIGQLTSGYFLFLSAQKHFLLMSAAGVHFTFFVQGGPSGFKGNKKILTGAKGANSRYWVEWFSNLNQFPLQGVLDVLCLQFVDVSAKPGLVIF